MKHLYFDHAASTPMTEKALHVLKEASEKLYANAAAAHKLGAAISERIEMARNLFLKNLEAENHDLIFVSSATEANNMIFNTISREVLASPADHPSVTIPAEKISEAWVKYDITEALDGSLIDKVTEDTKLVVLTHVNSTSGLILPISGLCEELKKKNPDVHIHIDASQSFGKLPLSLKNLEADSIALSAHKMGGPKGISALVCKKNLDVKPMLLGGGHEEGLRSSTPAPALILSWAACLNSADVVEKKLSETEKLHSDLRSGLEKASVVFPFENTSPYILTLIHPKLPSDLLLRHLETHNIFTASSSACSSKVKGFNSTFAALGIEEKYHKNVLRISMGLETTEDEVDQFIEIFNKVVEELS